MIVVSDTSPITALLQAGLDHLLPALFQRVVIPPAVRSELLRAHTSIPGWLEVVVPSVIPSAVRAARLDTGETEALALALELHADAILLDERLGRRAALGLGLPVTGLLGVLLLAKNTGRLPAIRPVIFSLREKAGCWFADPLVEEVLRAAGEDA